MFPSILSALLALFLLPGVPSVSWKAEVKPTDEAHRYQLVVTGQVDPEFYIHPMADPYVGTVLAVEESDAVQLLGLPYEKYEPATYKDEPVVTGTYVIYQDLEITASATVGGTVTWSACSGDFCNMPEDYEFSVPVKASSASGAGNLWALILEAILWGFLMLLTPCVFPMVPMTVSFFLKQSDNPAQGRFKAGMYGLFIVLLYTVPICIIIGLTWLLGGETVTADIFNWLATHWLPNILFFVIFMVFAASFFGAFEITLPASWTTKADAGSGKGGLLGVFFLALTLVLVSFSCTGPIVGTVLIKSTQGEFWTPMVTMLAFSIAFALPFALLAFFPSVLKKLPKSGGWLNSVKVVLGFIEVALGLKFLSVADQTYHWHLLDREVYLAIWIVCFTLLGLYLLGKLRFKHDSPLEYIGVGRLALAIIDLAFVVYMIPGMWGAPLKALSGYLPPMETQDFVLGSAGAPTAGLINASDTVIPSNTVILSEAKNLSGSTIAMPHGLVGYDNLEDGLAAAAASGKKVFVDITGHGCVNCREMEARVWSDPAVLAKLRNDFVLVALYMDDKVKLPEDKWVTTESGKVLKDVGRVNSHIAQTRFGVNAQPNYIILDPDGTVLAGPRGYNLDVAAFVKFLEP
jgi:thiol:disulfide interchange protein DsbD